MGHSIHRIALIAVAAGFVLHARLFLGGIIDDAFISFRYARNLVDGHGLVFNIGERVEGFTNFAWTMLAAASLSAGVSPLIALPAIGLVAGVALVVLVARASAASAGESTADADAALGGLPAAVLVGASTAVAFYAVSGLEETFFAALVAAASVALTAHRPVLFALLTTLAFLTRPEGGLLGVVGTLVLARDGWRDRASVSSPWWRSPALACATFAGLLAPYLAFKLWYFGAIVPNTFRAKQPKTLLALKYTAEGLAPLLPLCLLAIHARLKGLLRAAERTWLFIAASFVAACALVGPDWMPAYRFIVPIIPLVALTVGNVLGRALRGLGSADTRVYGVLALAAALVFVLANAVRSTTLAQSAHTWEARDELSRQLARQLSARGVRSVATINIGLLAWDAPKVAFVDLAGLVDATIAGEPGGHLEKHPPDTYLTARDADLYVLTSSRPVITPGSKGAQYVPDTDVERYVFSRPWFLERYRYAGSLQFYATHFYHLFERRRRAFCFAAHNCAGRTP